MALRRGIDSDSVTHVCKGRVLFFQLADIMSNIVALPYFFLLLTRLYPFNLTACGLSACCPTLKAACYHATSKDLLPGGWPAFRGGSHTR